LSWLRRLISISGSLVSIAMSGGKLCLRHDNLNIKVVQIGKLCPIYLERRRDSTVELRRVDGVNAPVGSRDPVHNFLRCWAIEVGDR